ncbi:unnamed protein product [Nezara viridula]|uniref:Uncharacterized protein n=1 Tax=Nezara viridula TaxID=85310 RepID=A0A9P0H909_NEZVI|nr:unnamed protein product [Nezara viridula]
MTSPPPSRMTSRIDGRDRTAAHPTVPSASLRPPPRPSELVSDVVCWTMMGGYVVAHCLRWRELDTDLARPVKGRLRPSTVATSAAFAAILEGLGGLEIYEWAFEIYLGLAKVSIAKPLWQRAASEVIDQSLSGANLYFSSPTSVEGMILFAVLFSLSVHFQ